MNLPKKIWVDVLERDIATWEWEEGTPYIREDVVLELVEALKDIRNYEFSHRYIKDITKAALKKLEDSHE